MSKCQTNKIRKTDRYIIQVNHQFCHGLLQYFAQVSNVTWHLCVTEILPVPDSWMLDILYLRQERGARWSVTSPLLDTDNFTPTLHTVDGWFSVAPLFISTI